MPAAVLGVGTGPELLAPTARAAVEGVGPVVGAEAVGGRVEVDGGGFDPVGDAADGLAEVGWVAGCGVGFLVGEGEDQGDAADGVFEEVGAEGEEG